MPVIYNDQPLVPAPLIDIQKNFIRDALGKVIHVDYTFVLSGTIVSTGDQFNSPGNQGIPLGMEGVLAEQQRIRSIFSVEGGRLEVSAPDGGGPSTVDAFCTVSSIDFPKGQWYNRGDYTITLKSRAIAVDLQDADNGLDSYAENWTITQNEDGSYNINHEIQAKAALVYDVSGQVNTLIKAKQWVQNRMVSISTTGLSSVPIDFSLILNSYSANQNYWNKSVVESVDSTANSYRVVETFIYNPSGNYREIWNASISYETNNLRRASLTISGDIAGFADNISNTTLKLTNAETAFQVNVEPNLYTRLQTFLPAGFTLNPTPITKQITYERLQGVIRYSYNYSALMGTLITNAIEENISVTDSGSTDVFAQIPIPGRVNGPLIQAMNTVTSPERTVNISAIIQGDTAPISLSSLAAFYGTKPNTDAIILSLAPNNSFFFVKQNVEEWHPLTKRYSRTVSWQMLPVGPVFGVPTKLSNY